MRTMSRLVILSAGLASALLLACGDRPTVDRSAWSPDADARGHAAPTTTTKAAQAAVRAALPLDDPTDRANAERGRVAADPEVHVTGADGRVIWSTRDYAFVDGDAPDSVNPSLWRQAGLNGLHGLFEVVPGVHQVRGYDLANMTLIEGETGYIVVDPLTSVETAAAALDLARRHLGDRPVVAVIFTHSHVDHFGGVEAVLPEDPEAREALRIVAPAHFTDEASSENVIAGPVMLRRASFMYGMSLERTPRGHVDTGLGKQPAQGTVTLASPTDHVDHSPQPMTLDGVRFVFQYVPHTEAPTELTFYLPDHKAFCGAEIVSHNMHNLYTLRGAKVRDALRWSDSIQESIRLFPETEVVFASHHWPVWGKAEVAAYLSRQRDVYKFIHDQTLRLASQGHVPQEIAEALELPPSLAQHFGNRGYYGTLRHNAKAVYQWYFGWYDGNPAHLDPLPPVEASRRYVEAMGGVDAVVAKGQAAFDAGDYRWAAQLLDHAVFADPAHEQARETLARAYDQLGYRAESGPWRDVYLTGAHELRHGASSGAAEMGRALDLLRSVPLSRFLDALATRLDARKAADAKTVINFVFTDLDESHVLWIENAVLHHEARSPDPEADVTIRLTHPFFLRIVTRQVGVREAIFSDDLSVEGSRTTLLSFFTMLEAPNEQFPIVTP
jgi:alkyl sulfatase BDS1-like metallo-beta-lactamase superfamily hydrolase